jgi:hypothetical protein
MLVVRIGIITLHQTGLASGFPDISMESLSSDMVPVATGLLSPFS